MSTYPVGEALPTPPIVTENSAGTWSVGVTSLLTEATASSSDVFPIAAVMSDSELVRQARTVQINSYW